MLNELLPSPVLSIGLTGHRDVGMEGAAAEAVERGIGAVFGALGRALAPAVAQESAYFSTATPIMRLVTMGAEGADLLGSRAAGKHGLEISFVIPFAWDEYRKDFSPAAASEAAAGIAQAKSVLELPGQRDEGPRAYERANEVILSNIDLLLAVWDGARARGRAGTGDVVQAAVEKGIPIIVIEPHPPSAATIVAAPPRDDFEPPAAGDLPRRPLPPDLTDFVRAIIRPPPRQVKRQGLSDFIAETPGRGTWRFEYPLLLNTVARIRSVRRLTTAVHAVSASPASPTAVGSSRTSSERVILCALDRTREIIDNLAVRYGRLFRSSLVAQYLIVILGIWISGVIGLLFPSVSAASIFVQVVGNGLILADAGFRSRHRWQERWLDYRVIAERLRWLRFRSSFGLGAGRSTPPNMRRSASWTDWYLKRIAHAFGPPRGKIDSGQVAAAAVQLTDVEIPDQIDYHRATFRRLGLLERRLSFAAHVALIASLGVAAVLAAVAAVKAGGLAAIGGWKPLAIVMLTVLPATMTALNGLRVDADLVRLIERSAQTIALLFRIRRVIVAAPPAYDHIASNMQRLASIMSDELAEWRLVIETRRSRSGQRKIKNKRNYRFLRSIRGAILTAIVGRLQLPRRRGAAPRLQTNYDSR